MALIHFTKAEGAQNDFLIVDDYTHAMSRDRRAAFARAACDRRRGVGGDGVIFIEKAEDVDFVMAFHNPDGTDGSMCGNGGRAAALYAFTRGLANERMRFRVLDRLYRAEMLAHGIRLHFPPPLAMQLSLSLDVTAWAAASPGAALPAGAEAARNADAASRQRAHFVHNGAPHVVVLFDDLPHAADASLDAFELGTLAPVLRHHPLFRPDGANVNIVAPKEKEYRIRTYEKGVEAETAACGTGTLASGMVLHAVLGVMPPVHLRTRGGDLLIVDFTPDPAFPPGDPRHYAKELSLEGPARLVFEGTFDEAAYAPAEVAP